MCVSAGGTKTTATLATAGGERSLALVSTMFYENPAAGGGRDGNIFLQ
jgi:hypothetical protein